MNARKGQPGQAASVQQRAAGRRGASGGRGVPPAPRSTTPESGPAETCPVALLAAEAAAAYRLLEALSNDDTRIAERLDAGTDGVSSIEVRRDMYGRLDALKALAVQRRGHTMKGALFQLYVLAERFYDMPGDDTAPRTAWAAVQLQLAYSAIAVIETTPADDDLAVLRRQMLPAHLDVRAVADRLLAHHRPSVA